MCPFREVIATMSENETSSNLSKRRKVAETNSLSNLHHNADLPKAAADLKKAFASHVDLISSHQVDTVETSEMLILNAAKLAACAQGLKEKSSQIAAESDAKISKLTQHLKDAETKVKLGKINHEIAERLVEQVRQEKYIVELKSTREKACLKRKIEELEMELQQRKDRFNDALLDAEVDGYNKCVNKAKEKGLRYKKLLLDPVYDPTDNQQEKFLVTPPAESFRDPVSSEEKALFDPADPMFYSSIIKVLAKNNLEDHLGGVVSKKVDNGTQKPTSSSLNISKNYKQLKDCKTELTSIMKTAFILGYNKCAEFIGKSNVYDPSKHNLKAFVASEVVHLGISAPSSYNNEQNRDK